MSSGIQKLTTRAERAPEGRAFTAWAFGHHGEILQGIFYDEARSTLQPGLITLPYRVVYTEAVYVPGEGDLSVRPEGKRKARRAAELTLAHLGARYRGGWLSLETHARQRRGLGSSTMDTLATFRAVAAAHAHPLSADRMASIAVAAEGASDATMFDHPHLFAQRSGHVIDHATAPLPQGTVLGLDLDPGGNGVDTLAAGPPPYSDEEVGVFRVLRSALDSSVRRNDITLLGAVATASAEINQHHRRLSGFETLKRIARRHRAVGVQIAHSGTVAGVLFDQHSAADIKTCRDELTETFQDDITEFAMG